MLLFSTDDVHVSDLDEKNLYGTIPPQLISLSASLTGTLNLHDNQLTGPIPSGIGSLKDLEDGLYVASWDTTCLLTFVVVVVVVVVVVAAESVNNVCKPCMC
mgnify:CR=1 FL=1